MSEKYEVTILIFCQMYCTVMATPCDQYLNFIPDHMKITNRKAECRLKIYTEMCLWKDVFIAIETYNSTIHYFPLKLQAAIIVILLLLKHDHDYYFVYL